MLTRGCTNNAKEWELNWYLFGCYGSICFILIYCNLFIWMDHWWILTKIVSVTQLICDGWFNIGLAMFKRYRRTEWQLYNWSWILTGLSYQNSLCHLKQNMLIYGRYLLVNISRHKLTLVLLQVDENGKIHRLRRECPADECGAGVFMASHFDRHYCGKCCLTYCFNKPEDKWCDGLGK